MLLSYEPIDKNFSSAPSSDLLLSACYLSFSGLMDNHLTLHKMGSTGA